MDLATYDVAEAGQDVFSDVTGANRISPHQPQMLFDIFSGDVFTGDYQYLVHNFTLLYLSVLRLISLWRNTDMNNPMPERLLLEAANKVCDQAGNRPELVVLRRLNVG